MNNLAFDQGAVVAGKYVLLEPLPADAGCRSYKARHKLIERFYTTVVYPAGTFAGEAERAAFLARAEKAASMVHNCVLPPLDCGVLDDGSVYIVQELARGGTLSAQLAERGALPVKQALLIFKDVLAGAAYAHDQGVVHGAINPAAVYVDKDGRRLKSARLGDFARVRNLTDGEKATAREKRADVHALGLLLYSMITGRPVPMDTQAADLHIPRGAPGWLSRLISRAVASAFEDAGALARELEHAVDLHDMPTPVEPLPVVRAPLFPLQLIALLLATLTIGVALFATFVWRPDSRTSGPDKDFAQREAEAENDPLLKEGSSSAEDLMRHERFAEAIAAYNSEIQTAIKRGASEKFLAAPYEHRALCYEKLQQAQAALADLQSALAIRERGGEHGSEVVNDQAQIGVCLAFLGRYDEARRHFEAALALKKELMAAGEDANVFPDLGFLQNCIARLTTETKKRTR